jgi:hypothetical protein
MHGSMNVKVSTVVQKIKITTKIQEGIYHNKLCGKHPTRMKTSSAQLD